MISSINGIPFCVSGRKDFESIRNSRASEQKKDSTMVHFVIDLTNSFSSEDESSPRKKPKSTKIAAAIPCNLTPCIHWSRAPDEVARYSDWTMRVTFLDDSGKNDVCATYSVHKMVLGPKSPDYFERMFLGGFSESIDQESKFLIPKNYSESGILSLEHVEYLLDWFYSDTKLKAVEPSMLFGLAFLADYWSLQELSPQVHTQIRNHLRSCGTNVSYESSRILGTFYKHATLMRMDDLKAEIVDVCARNPKYMSTSLEVIKTVPGIPLWIDVFIAKSKCRQLRSRSDHKEIWSELLSEYLQKYPSAATANDFSVLTAKEVLPSISSDAALFLMHHEQRLGCTVAGRTGPRLTCLQSRCARALVDPNNGEWKIVPGPGIQKQLEDLPSTVLTEILMLSISHKHKSRDVKSWKWESTA